MKFISKIRDKLVKSAHKLYYCFIFLIVNHPLLTILSTILYGFITCFLILWFCQLPEFDNPYNGFITRGTPISTGRLTKIKLNKLVESKDLYQINDLIRNYQENKVTDSDEIFKELDSSNFSSSSTEETNLLNEDEPDHLETETKSKRESSFLKIKSKRIKKKVKDSFLQPFLGCDPVFSDECSQIIIESKDPIGNSIMSFDSILIQCQFIEQFLRPHLESILTNKSSNHDIIFESLPGSIAKFSRKKSCNELKRENVENFTLIFKYCASMFNNLPDFDLTKSSSNDQELPSICRDQNLFDTFKYLIEKDFIIRNPNLKLNLNTAQLQQTLILLNNQNSDDLKPPEVRYSNIYISINKHQVEFLLPFYQDYLEPNFLYKPLSLNTHNKNYQIIAVNFDIKIDLFKKYIKPNLTWLILISMITIIAISLYTRNAFLSFSILICCSISLIHSYAIYKFIFKIEFFSFLNIFHIFFQFAIAVDNLFILNDTWKVAKSHYKSILAPNANSQMSNTLYRRIEAKSRIQTNETSTSQNNAACSISKITLLFYLEKCVAFLYKNTIVSIFIKNLSIFISYLVNLNSSIIIVRLFGIFITMSIVINLILILIILPSCLVLQVKYSKIFHAKNIQSLAILKSFFCPIMIININIFIKNIINQIRYFYNRIFEQWLPDLIISLRYVFITLLISLSLLSFVIIFYKPSLILPITSSLQFLSSSNPLEHYDRYLSRMSPSGGIFLYQSQTKPFIKVNYIFGLLNQDTESRVSTTKIGDINFDYENFDFYEEKSQLWLYQFCKDLKAHNSEDISPVDDESDDQVDYFNLKTPSKKLKIINKFNSNPKLNQLDNYLSLNETLIDFDSGLNENKICLFDLLKTILTRKCPATMTSNENDQEDKIQDNLCCDQSYPFEPKILQLCLKNRDFLKNYISINENFLFEKLYYNKTNGLISVVEFQQVLSSTWTPFYKTILNEVRDIEDFLRKHLKYVIVDLSTKIDSKYRKSSFATSGFFVSELDFFDFQQSLLHRTTESIFISISIILMVILLITKNICITILTFITAVMSNATTFSILTLLGWQLNAIESICILLSTGLSLNFLIHFATSYHNITTNSLNENLIDEPMTIFFKRENNTKLVIKYTGSTIFMTTIIYMLTGFGIVSSFFSLYPIFMFGLFLILILFINSLYGFFLFLPIFSIIGPINNLCKINSRSDSSEISNEINPPTETHQNRQYDVVEAEVNVNYNERNVDSVKSLNETSRLSCFTTSFNVAPNGNRSNSKIEQPSMVLSTF